MFQQVDVDLTTDSGLLKSIKVEGDPLSKLFMCGPEVGHLHIIVKRPAGT